MQMHTHWQIHTHINAYIGTAFNVIVSFPLVMHTMRDSTVHFVETIYAIRGSNLENPSKQRSIVFYGSVVVWSGIALLIAILELPLDAIFNLTGPLGFLPLCVTIPGILYVKSFPNPQNAKDKRRVYVGWFFFIFGMSASILALVSLFLT